MTFSSISISLLDNPPPQYILASLFDLRSICVPWLRREAGDSSRRGSGIFQLCVGQEKCWGSNLSDVTAGAERLSKQRLATTGEASLKLICIRWPTRTRKRHTIAHRIHNPLCQRNSLVYMGSDRAVIPFIFVLLSTGIWHLDEPTGRAERSLKTATKTSLCPSLSMKWREEQQAQWKKCKPCSVNHANGPKCHSEYCSSTTLDSLICC